MAELPASVRHQAAAVLRAWGILTAGLRPPPEFLVIGTKRGGTTSLGRYLFAHPQVTPLFPARISPKGVRYFDEHADRDDRWYRSHFATVLARGPAMRPRRFAGEATANYLFDPEIAERAHRAAPEARIVALVRDPVDRAWSHWRERTRRGVETLSFEDALAAEEERIDAARHRGALGLAANLAYRGQGCYADLLPAWLDRFGPERMLVLVSEEFFGDPAATYAQALTFLGLRPHDLSEYRPWNFQPPEAEMRGDTREALESAFEPENRRLEALLGRSLPWRHRR